MTAPVWPSPPTDADQRVDGSIVFGDVIQVRDVGGDVTITTDRPPYRSEDWVTTRVELSVEQARAQPSRLLLPRHHVVPFAGRREQSRQLAEWMGHPGAVTVRLVYAAGGQGKTRLAAHVAAAGSAAGWHVCRVVHAPAGIVGSRVDSPGSGGLLAVVDYADRWPASHLLALLTQLHDLTLAGSTTVRVLMLARSSQGWWSALSDRLDSIYGMDAAAWMLPPLGDQVNRDRLYRQARESFAAAMQVPGTGDLPIPARLGDAGFGHVLAIHMAALVSVDAHHRGMTVPSRPQDLSAYLLRRERAHWQHLHARDEGRKQTSPEMMGRVVYVATLTGALPRLAARSALEQVSLTEPGVDTILDDHRFCYPPDDPRTVLQQLQPDRLSEDLLALSTPGHPHDDAVDGSQSDDWADTAAIQLLSTTTDTPEWIPRAVTVLVETAHRWPHIARRLLYPLIQQRPDLALVAGGATLTRLAELPDIDITVLQAIAVVLPAERHVDLDTAAAAITDRLIPHRLAMATSDAERASLHALHGRRLAYAGRRDDALAAVERATFLYRQLTEVNPDAYSSGLAMSLNDLGLLLSQLGRWEDALAAVEEAATVFRQLCRIDSVAHMPNLAMSLNNLGMFLSKLGRPEEALARAAEAVEIRRRLTQIDPVAYLPNLAGSLTNLGVRLAEAGLRDQALAPAEEAVELHRQLVRTNPTTHLPNLAGSLNNLGLRLSAVGRLEQALAAAEEAVKVHRQLAQANAGAFLPDLALSLSNLGMLLATQGRREEARGPAEEAVKIRRGLAQANPTAHLPELAGSLSNLGMLLSKLGRPEEARGPAAEAVEIWRRLAKAYPVAHLADLAGSLNNLGMLLTALGQREEALARVLEATGIYRQRADTNPAAYIPELAKSLSNLGILLSDAGRQEEALAHVEEAASIYRQLAQTNREAHLPELGAALTHLSIVLPHLGRFELALAAAKEAVEVHRRLIQTNPTAHPAGLAASLNNLSIRLSTAGQPEEALAYAEEATKTYRQLADANPAAYLPDLGTSLKNLGLHLEASGRQAEAAETMEDAIAIYERLPRPLADPER